MAETENTAEPFDFESRLRALEKSIADLRRTSAARNGKIIEIRADAETARANSVRIVEMLEEVLPLVRKAAPLLDSPVAKLAQSPAGSVLQTFMGGRRGR